MLDDLADLFEADAEASAAIARFNATTADFTDGLIDELIRSADLPGDALCCRSGNLALDRVTFLTRAEALAAWLQRNGVGRGSIVGIVMEPSPARIMALYAAIRAGGVAMPIDHALPDDRIAMYLQDSRSSALLIDASQAARGWTGGGRACLQLPPDGEAGLPPEPVLRDPARDPADWCYVVYTSGTTGKPKAAINNHRALVNRLDWMARDIAITPTDRICHKTPFGFDVSVWEQLLPLLSGAAVHIAPDNLRREPEALFAFFAEHRISISHFVPSQLGEFATAAKGSAPPGLRCIVASGEALPASTAKAVLAWPEVALHNYYGPSEAAIDVTGWSVARDLGHDVAIGPPIQNCTIRILDAHLSEVPVGSAGEIYIGGIPVGNGYLHAPRISAERFVPDPFSTVPGALLYRTGDIGRWANDGMVWFQGRNDRQLKLRGLRIEPGEIESRLVEATGLTQCLVEPLENASGQAVLIGFAVSPQPLDEDAVLARLGQSLPAYMVPARIIRLDRMPVSANGKADMRALRTIAAEAMRDDAAQGGPLSEPAAVMARIWSALLGHAVGSDKAHFFKLGGDSITAIRLVARVRAEGYRIETQDVFEHPVLGDLAAAMVPISLAEIPLTKLAGAIRSATAAERLAITPVAAISGDAVTSDILERAATLAAALRPDLDAAACFDAGDCHADPAPLRIARRADLAVAFDRRAEGAIIAAFDPSVTDQASLEPLVAYLIGQGPLPRIERQPLGDPELPRAAAVEPVWPTTPVKFSRLDLPELPDRWHRTTSHERALDWIAAQVTTVLLRHAPASRLSVWLPESRAATQGVGMAPDRPVGRLGLSRCWEGASTPVPQDFAGLRSSDEAGQQASLAEGPVLRFRLAAEPYAESGARLDPDLWAALAAPSLARGEIAITLHDGNLVLHWPETAANWIEPALSELAACDLAVPDHWLVHRLPTDFPLSGLDQEQLGRLTTAYGAVSDVYPLAPLQEGMLMRAAYWPESDAYLNQNIIELRGPLDPAHVSAAWAEVCARYEILRSAYRWQDLPRPQAIIAEGQPAEVAHLDWSDEPEDQFEPHLTAFLDADRAVPFDLTNPGLWRLRLIRRAPDCHVIVWTHHHILLDGWCLALIWGDFAKAFAAAARGNAEAAVIQPRPYRDYIAWLAAHPPGDATRAYWRDRLAGAQACAFSTHAPDAEGLAATLRVPLAGERKAALDQACAQLGLTANAFIQASWSLLLSLRLGTSDVTHGVSISGRPPEMAGSDAMVGLFINLIPLRLKANPRQTAADFLKSVQDGLAAANRHGTLALPEILSHWQGRATPDQRLFDSLIAFENYPDENLPTSKVAGVEFVDRFCDEKTEYPIGLIVLPGDPFEVHFNYDVSHFSAAAIAAIRDDYLALLDRFIDHPDSTLATFELPSCSVVLQPEAVPSYAPIDLTDLLAPDPAADEQPALVGQGRSWTRAQLRKLVSATAQALRNSTPATHFAICAHRSADLGLAVLAAWHGGLVPIVINPALPDESIAAILRDSGNPLLITDRQTGARLDAFGRSPDNRTPSDANSAAADVLDLADLVQRAIDAPEPTPLRTQGSPAGTAAVLLTSGTTGTPKRVMVPMTGFANRIAWTRELYASKQPRLLANAAPGFDIGLWELAWPLACGGTVVIADDDDLRDMTQLDRRISEHAVTALHATPTFASAFCELPGCWDSVDLLVTGGELVTAERIRSLGRKMPAARIFQGYGPTEASVSVVDSPIDSRRIDEPLPLGSTMPGCTIRVLDPALRTCPAGAIGTIHIGGLPVGAGYWSDPRQTAAAFQPDPFGPPGSLLYNTGDKGFWSHEGLLHFAGRDDRQIKIRGFRVELDAVERTLGMHPLVRQTAVVACGTGPDTVLRAFVVTNQTDSAGGTSSQALRNWLARHLPRWAVPQSVTALDAMPVSNNGKTDYAALAALPIATAPAAGGDTDFSPANAVEQAIADCWENVLGEPPASRRANFFEAGGHSISAMQVIAQLQQELAQDDIRVPLFFKFPSVAGLAEALLTDAKDGCARHMTCLAEGDGVPLILIHPVEGLSHAYHPLARALPGQAVWAIEDPRFGTDDPFASLHDMAELYVEWVRNRFEGQPVMLGGWSFGGVVALEMAGIMARHDRAPGVIMIDSYNFAGTGGDPAAFARGATERLAGLDSETRRALHDEIVSNTCLALAAATARYDHPVVLIKSADQDPAIAEELGPDNGWSGKCPRLRTQLVAGDHYGLMQPPGLMATAAAVAEALAALRESAALDPVLS